MMTHRSALVALALSAALSALAVPAVAAENRCGWLVNPSPANWWLSDREGDWIMSSQGQDRELPGMDLVPDVTEHDFVATNGSYGHACACMKVTTSQGPDGKRIDEILSFRQLPISRCDKDKALPKPD